MGMRALLSITNGSASFMRDVARFLANGAVGLTPKDRHAAASIVRDRDPLMSSHDMTRQRTQRRSAINEMQFLRAKFKSRNATFRCFVDRVDVIVDTTKKSRTLGFDSKFHAL